MQFFRSINAAFASLGINIEDTLKVLTKKTNGGVDGVIKGTWDSSKAQNFSDFLVEPTGTPDLFVTVLAGMANVSDRYLCNESSVVVGPFVDNADRYDLVQLSSSKELSIKQGTSTPGATSPDADNIKVAEVHLDSSDGAIAAGDITDERTFS